MRFIQIETPETPFNITMPNIFKDLSGDFKYAVKFINKINRHADGTLVAGSLKEFNDINNWCSRSFGGSNFLIWGSVYVWVFLRSENQLMQFKLRWI